VAGKIGEQFCTLIGWSQKRFANNYVELWEPEIAIIETGAEREGNTFKED